jgi:hypothetical protein
MPAVLLIVWQRWRAKPAIPVWLHLNAALVVGVALFASNPLIADDDLKVVLLIPETDADDAVAVLENTRSQVVDLPVPVTVSMLRVANLPPETRAQQTLAEAIMGETGAGAVFWYDTSASMQVRFIYQSEDGIQSVIREFKGSGKDGIADAIGLIAGGTIRFLVRQGAFRKPSPPPAPRHQTQEKKVAPAPPDTQNRYQAVAIIGKLAYVAQLATLDPTVTQGGRLSLGVSFYQIWRFSFGLELFTPVESREDEVIFERLRFPLHIGVGLMATIGKWHLGGGVSAVFSTARHTPSSRNERIVVEEKTYRFLCTMELLAQAELELTDHFGVYTGLGAELFFQKVTYRIEDGPTLFEEYLRVQPKLLFGVVLYFR